MTMTGAPHATRTSIDVLIADDDEAVRLDTKTMLEQYPWFRVVAEAWSGLMAIERARLLQPSIVLMDVRLPGAMSGLEATRAISVEMPRLPVLMLTSHERPEYVLEAIRAGAAGYILKEATAEQLASTIEDVLTGDSAISSDLANRLLRRIAAEGSCGKGPHPGLEIDMFLTIRRPRDLSFREREILALITTGRTNVAIARDLNLSPHTVKGHVERIISKMGVSDRTQAAVKAIRLGLAA